MGVREIQDAVGSPEGTVLKTRTIVLSLAMISLCPSASYPAGVNSSSFRLTGYEATQRYTGLSFQQDSHSWHTIVFMDREQQFAETTPKAEGILDWSHVTAIRVTPTDSDPALKLAVIEFIDKYDQKHKTFEMGLIDDAHLVELKQRYGQFLKFKTP